MLKNLISKIKKLFKNSSSHSQNINYIVTDSNSEIVVYFAGNQKQLYQIEQWLELFEELNKHHKITFIIRNSRVIKKFIKEKEKFDNFEVRYLPKLEDILEFYKKNNHKIVLYVNNGMKNFHSLINNRAIHIHINHGESEKISTFSNQVKAYDYVFIVAEAALNKYKLNLNKINLNKFIKVGRPQIEYISKIPDFPTTDKNIILYAPTWEGGYNDMNYSSIKKYGLDIIKTLIEENYFIVYKPHPYIGARDKSYKDIHQKILNLLSEYKDSYVLLEGNIINLYPYIDLAIFDNSATLIDYLSFEKPYIITDFISPNENNLKPIITYGGENLNDTNISNLKDIISSNLKNDNYLHIRKKIKQYYLGDFDYSKKESTKTFISKIEDFIKERDELIKNTEVKQKEFDENILKILEVNHK